jgi:hypothetical protein
MNLIKNGFIILNLYCPLYLLFEDHLIITTIILKLLHINYYYFFGHLSSKLNHITKLFRPWVRLTDTGFYALIIYYFYDDFYPICFNIHFVISIAYWTIMIIFGFQDSDNIHSHELSIYITQFISSITHCLPLFLLTRNMCIDDASFNEESLYYTNYWISGWFLFIYIPWRLITNDEIYTVLNNNTLIIYKLFTIIFVFTLTFLSNEIGKIIQNKICV